MSDQIDAEREASKIKIDRLCRMVAFAKCCIKSGEPWTDRCEEFLSLDWIDEQ